MLFKVFYRLRFFIPSSVDTFARRGNGRLGLLVPTDVKREQEKGKCMLLLFALARRCLVLSTEMRNLKNVTTFLALSRRKIMAGMVSGDMVSLVWVDVTTLHVCYPTFLGRYGSTL